MLLASKQRVVPPRLTAWAREIDAFHQGTDVGLNIWSAHLHMKRQEDRSIGLLVSLTTSGVELRRVPVP